MLDKIPVAAINLMVHLHLSSLHLAFASSCNFFFVAFNFIID